MTYSEITLIASSVLTLIGLYMLYSGFGILKELNSEYSVGKTGVTLEIISPILVVLGAIGLLAILLPIVDLGNSSSTVSVLQPQIGAIIGIAFLVIIAAIILLVGIIMVLIGIYRVGEQFNNTLVKVGAILLLFLGFTDVINNLRSSMEQAEMFG